ncbi:DUF3515 domain-containing protein [Streptomyces albus]|uniref:DUF3515 domain-containing protein n=1 Tax=Streptomyces albus TaxID=1888 RepID=UPI003F51597F
MSTRPRALTRSHLTARAAVCGLLALAATACSGSGDPEVAAPSPSGKAARACRALHDALPQKVEGQQRGTADPVSDYTAVWGDPAIRLRCGVPRPARLTPGDDHYDPTSEAAEVNGVSWLIEQRDGEYRFTTTGRVANVEVTVPDHYEPQINPLADLAGAVKRAVPEKKD